MGRLSVRLLGAPEVRHDGRPVAFRTRKTLALLSYLATEGGLHAREQLATLLWPDSDAALGRASLRNTLRYLHTALGEDEAGTGTRWHLTVERESLALDPASGVDLDLRDLQEAVRDARARLRQGDSALVSPDGAERQRLIDRLQAALNAYRGGFLAGFSLEDAPDFDDWATQQRELWHRRADAAFDALSTLLAEGGETGSALEVAVRWVAHDPLNEAAHRRLIQTHLVAGDRTAALRAYADCRATLRAEIGVEPTPETEALAERARQGVERGAGGVERNGGETMPRSTSNSPTLHAPRPTPHDLPLVGRAEEFSRLVAAYQAARRGQFQVVAVDGEAGIGKTRLATEFMGWAVAQGAEVLRGGAFETGGRLPYQPLVEALRGPVARDAALRERLGVVWLAELTRLLPELRAQVPDLPAPAPDEAAAQTRLSEAVVRLVSALAATAPVILVVDDIQWADAASLDLLRYAARRWAEEGVPFLLVLNLRAEALHEAEGQRPALAGWLAGLGRDLALTRLSLGALTGEATARLVEALALDERGVDDATAREGDLADVARWLFAETGGQPFYLTETIKSLFESGTLATRRRPDGGLALDQTQTPGTLAALRGVVPPGVREVIRSRLAPLAPGAFAFLVAGAVLGQSAPFATLGQVAGVGEDDALTALDRLCASRLLRETSDGSYAFTHDKIRDVVYTEAGDARRRIFHRRAFEALRATADAPARLAHHALAAGLRVPAFEYSFAAGDEASRVFAVRDAIAQYEVARRVSAELADSGKQTVDIPFVAQRDLFLRLGRAYELSGDYGQAREVYAALLALARAQDDPLAESATLNRLATLTAQGDTGLNKALVLLEQASAVAERAGDPQVLAETEWNLAQLAFYSIDPLRALAHGERALLLATELALPELRARCLNVIAVSEMASCRCAPGLAHAEEARSLYAALGNRAMEADTIGVVAAVQTMTGATRAGLASARLARAISVEIENAWGQIFANFQIVVALLDTGDYDEALILAQEAVALARAQPVPLTMSLSHLALGMTRRALLDLPAARLALEEALAHSDSISNSPYQEPISGQLCAVAVLAGEWEDARRHAERALAGRDGTYYSHNGLARWYQTRALLGSGDHDRVAASLDRFSEQIGVNRRYRLLHRASLAVLAEARGDSTAARAHLDAALALAADLNLPGEVWPLAAALARIREAIGDVTGAQEARAQADLAIRSLAERITDPRLRGVFLRGAAAIVGRG